MIWPYFSGYLYFPKKSSKKLFLFEQITTSAFRSYKSAKTLKLFLSWYCILLMVFLRELSSLSDRSCLDWLKYILARCITRSRWMQLFSYKSLYFGYCLFLMMAYFKVSSDSSTLSNASFISPLARLIFESRSNDLDIDECGLFFLSSLTSLIIFSQSTKLDSLYSRSAN